MKHETSVRGYNGTMEQLAEEIGNLRYDAAVKFLEYLATNIEGQARKDRARGRVRLSRTLQEAASKVTGAKHEMRDAFQISQPYMAEELKREPPLID